MKYNIRYDDGDTEDGVVHRYVMLPRKKEE